MASTPSSHSRSKNHRLNVRRVGLAPIAPAAHELYRQLKPNIVTLRVAVAVMLDMVMQGAIDALDTERIGITGAAQIVEERKLPTGRIVLRYAYDKPRALEILRSHHITAD